MKARPRWARPRLTGPLVPLMLACVPAALPAVLARDLIGAIEPRLLVGTGIAHAGIAGRRAAGADGRGCAGPATRTGAAGADCRGRARLAAARRRAAGADGRGR